MQKNRSTNTHLCIIHLNNIAPVVGVPGVSPLGTALLPFSSEVNHNTYNSK